MPTCVAFLRAINVTGRFVKMSLLVEHFKSIGYLNATSFINTGNIVLGLPTRPSRAIEQQIQERLEELLGFRSEVFLRSTSDLRSIVTQATELRRATASAEVNVCFLQAPLSSAQQAAVLARRTESDRFDVSARHVLWACRVSQSQSAFSNAVLERTIGARATLRRQSTLSDLLEVIDGA